MTHCYCLCRQWKALYCCERSQDPTCTEGGSNPTRKVPQMIALNKFSFVCRTVPLACRAGRQELSWELQAPAWWCVTSFPWPQPTFTCAFPPLFPQKQCPSGREEEQVFACSLCGSGWVTSRRDRTDFSQAGELCLMQQL